MIRDRGPLRSSLKNSHSCGNLDIDRPTIVFFLQQEWRPPSTYLWNDSSVVRANFQFLWRQLCPYNFNSQLVGEEQDMSTSLRILS